jgi:hypothetical protein
VRGGIARIPRGHLGRCPPAVGTAVTGVDGGRGIDFGGLTTCRASLAGHVTGLEMFGGGTISVDRISFTGARPAQP